MSGGLPEPIVAVLAALQAGDGGAALAAMPAAEAAMGDAPRLRARLHAWQAQAHQLAGDPKAASRAIRQAIALAGEHEPDQLPALRQLQAGMLAQAAALAAGAAPRSAPTTPLERSLAALDAGDVETGTALARLARAEATEPRDVVLALLALARVPEEAEAAIREAAEVADASDDKNLVTAVAKAARAAGATLAPRVF